VRLRGIRGGVLLSVDAELAVDDVAASLAPHAAALTGKVALEVAERVPFELLAAVAEQVAAAGGSVSDVRPPAALAQVRSETVIKTGTVRSGGRLASSGSLVVLGDVNPGAELVAEGDVIVTGVLRGVAHAGAARNERAVIYAERILSPQLRIAGALAMGDPDEVETTRKTPEMAVLQDGQIVVRPWSA
jgi:septum site-determining protein MinC